MGRALLILLFCPILALLVFGIGNAGERGGLIALMTPPGSCMFTNTAAANHARWRFSFPQITNRCAVVQPNYSWGGKKRPELPAHGSNGGKQKISHPRFSAFVYEKEHD
jgi:hypothetical protein